MKVASFNINGIKARLPNLINWLNTSNPEIVALQEIKSVDQNFPRDEIEELGYNIVTHGQKGFNGVAILSKYPIEDISFGLPGDKNDNQSRWLEATIESYRICCLYLPNGNPVDTEKYHYKINFMDRLFKRAKDFIIYEQKSIILGDFNVIPYEIDAKNISEWSNDALYRQEIRLKFFKILNIGYTDSIRSQNPFSEIFTFWDYQKRSWERNNGIRIDHILLCPESSDSLISCGIDSHIRETDKPSDHVPVWVEVN
tara:strand:- start:329 stop:1096 length:768 start_codon:yes stop_codon:yes gene_type:complete